jgi:putative oxidoreductase
MISAVVMANAVIAVFHTKGAGWLWNLGGVEYLVFWGISSLALAANAWKQEWIEHGRVGLLAPAATRTVRPPA